jgi:hypothetical protein
MWKNRTLNQGQARTRACRRWLALCLTVSALLPVVGSAQAPPVVTLKSGLHSVPGGDEFLLTVAEVGSSRAAATVAIEFRDALNKQRAIFSGTLTLTQPVRLRLRIPPTVRFDQLRAIVTIRALAFWEESAPIATLEDIDVDSFRVVPAGPPCTVTLATEVPSGGGDTEGNCDGWRKTTLVAPQ